MCAADGRAGEVGAVGALGSREDHNELQMADVEIQNLDPHCWILVLL